MIRIGKQRLLAAMVVCAGACSGVFAQTGSQTCAGAGTSVIPAAGGTVNGAFLGGGSDSGAAVDCEAFGASATGSDVFFSFTPSNAGPWVFSTCLTVAGVWDDSIISVHPACPATLANSLGCDDDTCDFFSQTPGIGLTPGVTYVVRVARFTGAGTDSFVLTANSLSTNGACCNNANSSCVLSTSAACGSGNTFQGVGSTCAPNPCPAPANDSCSTPAIAVIGANNGTLNAATNDGDSACDGGGGVDVYFSFTPAATGVYQFSLCGSPSNDTTISLHSACPADATNQLAGGCNDDFCGLFDLSSIQAISLNAGVPVIVRVNTYDAATTVSNGNFTLNISLSSVVLPPNDSCSNAVALTLATPVSGVLTDATGGAISSCSGTDVDTWYTFTPASTGNYTITTTPATATDWSTSIAVFNIPCDPAIDSDIACDFQPGIGEVNTLIANLTGGTTYLIRTGAFAGDVSNFSIVVTVSNTGACCNPTTGVCTLTDAVGCVSPNVFQSVGTLCTPTNPCPQPPPPANDNCGSAAVAIIGANNGTFAGATNDGDAACDGDLGRDVYFSFTPATTSGYRLSLCGGPSIDTVLSVHSGCPADEFNQLGAGCNDDFCGILDLSSIEAIVLNAGTTYTIRVSLYDDTVIPDNFTFTLNISTNPAGACCGIAGGCFITAAADCVDGPVFQGLNTTCDPSPCPGTGSCCFPNSSLCFTAIEAFCVGTGGGTWVSGATCDPNPCAGSVPANDPCTTATNVTTLPFTSNVGSDFATNDGPVPSAGSCNSAGAQAEGLDNSIFYRWTASFTGDLRVRHTNYGTYDTVMVVYSGADCNSLTEVSCNDDPEPYDFNLVVTAGTTYWFGIGDFGVGDGGGWNTFRLDQVAGGGNIACCRGSTCSVIASAGCTDPTGTAGAFATTATACNVGSATTPCCYADYNKAGGIEINDIFDFLNDWFAGSNFADTGSDGSTAPDINSIFDFLNAWFAGGC